jgi:hypothetical protein
LPDHPSIARFDLGSCGLRGVRGDASSVIAKDCTDALSGLCTLAHFWEWRNWRRGSFSGMSCWCGKQKRRESRKRARTVS